MSKVRLIGLASIEMGDVGGTGLMGTTLTTLEAFVPDSAHVIFEPPGVTDLYVEEEDLPDIQIIGASKKTVEFATRNVKGDLLALAFEGGYNATTGVWSMSTVGAVQIKEQCFKLISKAYGGTKLTIEIPRASVRPSADLRFTKTESGTVAFICDVLIPATSTKVSPMVITES